MFAVVAVFHWSIQRLLGRKTEGDTDELSNKNNSSDKPEDDEAIVESFEKLKVTTVSAAATSHVLDRVHVHGWQDFPFLSDRETVRFLKNSHVIFIMRGLPGSGKSTLVQHLQQTYPEAVVCSADHFFTDSSGNYNYDATKISNAHTECQKKATESCLNGEKVIIIDNTNIQVWTMAHYLSLAQYSHYYHCLLVEPNTPWRYDVDELARRNLHKVDKEYISKKVKLIRDQKVQPMFYGWFLTQEDSSMLISLSHKILKKCCHALPEGTTIEDHINKGPGEILNSFNEKYNSPKGMLHCTARFLGSSSKHVYHDREIIRQSMGKKFTMHVVGFAFTERTVSALIDLDADKVHNTKLQIYEKLEEEVYREKHKDDKSHRDSEKYFHHGCSAHITITFARGGQAKFSGEDILEMCEMQYLRKYKSMKQDFGLLTAYCGNMYKVVLSKPIILDCLFQGFYSTRGHR